MRIDDRFSPTIAALARPSGANFLNILGDAALDYTQDREDDEIREIKMEEIKKKVKDDRAFADFSGSGKNLREWMADGGVFLTADAAAKAEGLSRSRAQQRLADKRYGLSVGKTGRKESVATPMISSLDALNASLSDTKPDTKNTKTVTVYKDGKPVTYTVGG